MCPTYIMLAQLHGYMEGAAVGAGFGCILVLMRSTMSMVVVKRYGSIVGYSQGEEGLLIFPVLVHKIANSDLSDSDVM